MARKWWTLAVVCTAIFMLLIDITVVNVALPQIQRALGARFTELQWVVDAYALALATCVLTAGSLADRLGRRRIFVAGLVVFTVASLACGLSPDPAVLIVARAVQGVGGAVMFSTSLALISQAFHGRERGTAFGVWGATTGAAVAIGPLVGGVLTTALSWRWIFFVNLPIGTAALALALWRLDESRDPDARPPDWPGLGTLTGGLFLLVYGLLEAERRGWTDALIVACLAGAAVLLVAFVAVEARRPERAMLDVRLFRVPTFTGAQITAFVVSAAVFSLFLYLTLYFQNILGYDALQAGLRLLPISVMSFLMAPVAGRLSAKLPVRLLLSGGLLLAAGGALLERSLDPGSSWTALLPGFILTGLGIGLVNPPLASVAIGVAPRERAGMASGVNNTFRQVGIATGIAAFGSIFQARVADLLAAGLHGTPVAGRSAQLAGAVTAGPLSELVARVPAPAREVARREATAAFVRALDELFLIAACVALVGALLAAVLVNGRDLERSQEAPPRPTPGQPAGTQPEPVG